MWKAKRSLLLACRVNAPRRGAFRWGEREKPLEPEQESRESRKLHHDSDILGLNRGEVALTPCAPGDWQGEENERVLR